jgi:hypothetical protein
MAVSGTKVLGARHCARSKLRAEVARSSFGADEDARHKAKVTSPEESRAPSNET